MDGHEPKQPESVLVYAIKSVIVAFVVVVVVVLVVVNVLFRGSGGGPGANTSPNPPAGQIWFGATGGDATARPGEIIQASAHLTRSVSSPGDVRVRVAKNAVAAVDQAPNALAGDIVRFTYTMGTAGTYEFTVVGANDGAVLATGTVVVH
ncbi:MAG: hypothetical protein U0838_08675 [Chloroflexota bacterium]